MSLKVPGHWKNKTRRFKNLILKSTTPSFIRLKDSAFKKGRGQRRQMNKKGKGKITSYRPSANNNLITLKTRPHEALGDCNNATAFRSRAQLQIAIPGYYLFPKCVPYYTKEAKEVLLQHLRANKHIDPLQIIPPRQLQGNCWFNAMFVCLFVSDKGRKFFHFFRQLMIEGRRQDGENIPERLRDALAIFNFAIEACLSGSHYAYEMDTNAIIREIYNIIDRQPDIPKVNDAGNPIDYYRALISYLGNGPLTMMYGIAEDANWKKNIDSQYRTYQKKPHVIIIDSIYGITTKQPKLTFDDGSTYVLDSTVVRDETGEHFCATLTCEGEEMGFDGLSFHRLVPFEWKNVLNLPQTWSFEGSKDNGKLFKWSFLGDYCILLYYRV